jgi:hypothetical protein
MRYQHILTEMTLPLAGIDLSSFANFMNSLKRVPREQVVALTGSIGQIIFIALGGITHRLSTAGRQAQAEERRLPKIPTWDLCQARPSSPRPPQSQGTAEPR